MPFQPLTSPVNTCKLGGVESPGICEIYGASSPRKWDEIEGYGWVGGLLVFHGLPLSKFSVRCTLYTDAHWEQWERFRRVVARPPIGTRPRALSIEHPQLAELGITAAVVEEVYAAHQVGNGVWEIEISLIESRTYKGSAVTKPDGAEATEDDPIGAANEATIKQLTGEAAGLTDELAR